MPNADSQLLMRQQRCYYCHYLFITIVCCCGKALRIVLLCKSIACFFFFFRFFPIPLICLLATAAFHKYCRIHCSRMSAHWRKWINFKRLFDTISLCNSVPLATIVLKAEFQHVVCARLLFVRFIYEYTVINYVFRVVAVRQQVAQHNGHVSIA